MSFERPPAGGEYQRELDEYKFTLQNHVYRPPNGDQVIGAGAEAQLADWDLFEPLLREVFRIRTEEIGRPINPRLLPNLVDRAIWSEADPDEGGKSVAPGTWPTSYIHPRYHRMLFRKILPEPGFDMYDNSFFRKLYLLEVMSNPATRGKPLQALSQLFPEYFGDGVQIFDSGSSANHILTALDLKYHPPATTIYRPNVKGHFIPDRTATAAFSRLLSRHPNIGNSLGADVWNWERDKDIRRWMRVNTVTPGELMAPPREVIALGQTVLWSAYEEYSLLDNVRMPHVGFAQIDLSSEKMVDEFLQDHPDRYDVIFLSTVLEQQTPEKRAKILEEIQKFKKTKEDGELAPVIEIIQDFVLPPDPANPQEPRFVDDIYDKDWQYYTLYKDPANPGAGWQVAFQHRTGRCNQTIIGDGTFYMDGKMVSIRERFNEFT